MDLEPLAGPHWAGWTISDDGMLYAPEWRKGLSAGDIRALPYLNASVAEYRQQARIAQAALAEAQALMIEAEKAARYYRDLVSREARFGLMLSRIT